MEKNCLHEFLIHETVMLSCVERAELRAESHRLQVQTETRAAERTMQRLRKDKRKNDRGENERLSNECETL